MVFNTIKLIYFSPTSTTRKIVQGMVRGIPLTQIEEFDLTLPDAETRIFPKIGQGLAILGTPVYAGRVPMEAVNRLRRVKAHSPHRSMLIPGG